MFSITNAMKNIYRQRKRYRLFVPLLLVCALLSGGFLTVAAPCRAYAEQTNTDPTQYTEEVYMQIRQLEDNARKTGQAAGKAYMGSLLVGAAAVLYVSSLMIGERFFDVGILFSVGLSKRQIFFSLFAELFTVCLFSLGIGLLAGTQFGILWLENRIAQGILPTALSEFISGRTHMTACLLSAAGILLIPLSRLTVRLIRSDPAAFIRDRI